MTTNGGRKAQLSSLRLPNSATYAAIFGAQFITPSFVSSGKSESSQVVGFLHQVGGNRIRHNKPITRYKDLLANSKQKQNMIMGIALSSVDNQVRQRACRNMVANKESNSHS